MPKHTISSNLAPLLRADTRMFAGHVVRWLEMRVRMARDGRLDLGSPSDIATVLAAHAQEVALEYSVPEGDDKEE